ncbi:hypothetical protein DM02DRAFT_650740 [Periconia macrospinosa]|uniref:BTB domain-containing protein n=1 Tax=Periconia macrospinosa TaxID=97972 RepID=A0A2V1E5L2_9PLEO|nr:hypothetical protein DM02DRAFT_650740 [Periconia macrospinosa]
MEYDRAKEFEYFPSPAAIYGVNVTCYGFFVYPSPRFCITIGSSGNRHWVGETYPRLYAWATVITRRKLSSYFYFPMRVARELQANGNMELFSDVLQNSVRDLFDSGKYSDLTVFCGVNTHKLHKMIVCERSEWFEHAVKKKRHLTSFNLSHEDPDIVGFMFEFMYAGDYNIPDAKDSDDLNGFLEIHRPRPLRNKFGLEYTYSFPHTCQSGTERPTCRHHRCCNIHGEVFVYRRGFVCIHCSNPEHCQGTEKALFTHAKVYEISKKYRVRGLEYSAIIKFRRACDIFWHTASFAAVIRYIFANNMGNNQTLRDIIIETILQHQQILEDPEVEEVVKEFSELAYALLVQKFEMENVQ